MNSFWGILYDRVKDRRYGSLFFFTLTALIGLLILVGALLKTDLRDFFGAALLLGFGFLLVWFIGAFCRAFRREKPSKYSRLSSDEVAKARSKLVKNRERKRA